MELTLHPSSSSAASSSCPSSSCRYVWQSLRSSSLLFLARCSRARSTSHFSLVPRAYIEKSRPVSEFVSKVVGALPIVGLLSRILSDDGGIGNDRIQFKEFCTRCYRNFSPEVPSAFYDFEERHGSVARPQYVLIWCWAAALGAGLLKTEDLMLGPSRLRVSFDIQYEEENLLLLMEEASKKRRQSKSPAPFVPYEARASKALDAICKCCIGKPVIDEEDVRLLTIILQSVFPGADKAEVENMVREKALIAEQDDVIEEVSQYAEDSIQRAEKEELLNSGSTNAEQQFVQEVAGLETR